MKQVEPATPAPAQVAVVTVAGWEVTAAARGEGMDACGQRDRRDLMHHEMTECHAMMGHPGMMVHLGMMGRLAMMDHLGMMARLAMICLRGMTEVLAMMGRLTQIPVLLEDPQLAQVALVNHQLVMTRLGSARHRIRPA